VLGRAQLPDGVGTTIFFDPAVQTGCVFDFKLIFADGGSQVYLDGRNVCPLGAVQFNERTSIGYPVSL
jgi:hypothetical protein